MYNGGQGDELAVHFLLFEVTGVAEFSWVLLFAEGDNPGEEMERVARTVERVCMVVVQVEQFWSDGEYVVTSGKNFFTTTVYPVDGIFR